MPPRPALPGQPESIWMATTDSTAYPPLEQPATVDAVIVGGGIAGLTTAYLLQKQGKKVAVIEADRIAAGVTGYTSAKITSSHSLIYATLIKNFGEDQARAYGQANQAGLATIRAIVKELNIECDLATEIAYVYAQDKKDLEKIRQEVASAQQLGLPASFVDKPDLPYEVAGAIAFADQARFHPRAYLLALAKAITKNGGQIYEETRACEVKEGEPCEVHTEKAVVSATDVVIATHFPFADRGLYFSRMHPHRSYVLGAYLEGPLPQGMFISTEPEHTFRIQPTDKGDLLLIGGEGHTTGQGGDTSERYLSLENWARKHFPIKEIAYRWSTQDNVTADKVPYIGRDIPTSKHVYVATGFGGWGMTNGTVAGLLLTDLICGRENSWEEVYSPNRFKPAASALTFIDQNAKVAGHFVGDHLKPVSELKDEDLEPGQGTIASRGGDKVAAYRDHQGILHLLSPLCTHLGCTLTWNSAEESWDCPCHGSRYDGLGKVIHGPATEDLKPLLDTI